MAVLTTGHRAPEFTLPTADGGRVSLAELRAGSPGGVIVDFYPKAGTPGCTAEACDFRDNLASLQGAGYAVVGVSPDPVEDLAAFAAEQRLTYPLGSDADHAVADAYGARGPKTLDGRTVDGVRRSTVVVAPDGTVRLARYDVQARGHVAELREVLLGA